LERKEKIYKYICHESYKPLTIKELAVVLDVPKSDYTKLLSLVEELLDEGKIVQSKKGRLKKASSQNIIYGTLRLTKTKNAFVTPDASFDGENEDIFIDRANVNFAFDGDTVSVRLLRSFKREENKSREGVVLKIVHRASDELTGTVDETAGRMIFVPDNASVDSGVISKDSINVDVHQKVVAKVLRFPDEKQAMKVRITEILGDDDNVATLIECVVREQKIPQQFSKESLKQTQNTPDVVSDDEIKSRVDFRSDRVITIDGEDARDLDDAVCVKKCDDGTYILYVHIADVSYYVGENTPIDLDAYERGTSVYLPDRVIPMLPRELSNGICSLNEGENRLTMSLEMHIDKNGDVFDYKLCEGVICSVHRMSYTLVSAMLDGDNEALARYEDIKEDIFNMKELAMILKERRRKCGAIDFSFPEPKIVLDENGEVSGVSVYETGVSNEIIEQFMLLANETIARYASKKELPFVYRVHEAPSVEKMATLQKYLSLFDIPFSIADMSKVEPSDIQSIVDSIKNTPKEAAISVLCLRSMMKARYTPENLGHFGLASDDYCHFTSPIRRYPDLLIHRMLRESIKKGITQNRKMHLTSFVERAALQSSETEIRAVDAERMADKVCACLYMKQFIGEEFDALISSVTDFGLFVEIDGCIEGLVPMAQLSDDYYVYEEEFMQLRGEKNGRVFALGDEVRVRLICSDARLRRIDFEIADMTKKRAATPKKASYYKADKNKKKKEDAKKSFRKFTSKKTRRKR